MSARPEPLEVLTVCGVGMGSSLMLRMTAERAFADLGVPARVQAADTSSARGMRADVILGQGMHTEDFQGKAPVVITVANFMDAEGLKRQLEDALREVGWLT